jgi:hypothetical protein
MTDYSKAIDILRELLEFDVENKDASALMGKASALKKQYEDKSAALAKKMFQQ